MTSITAPDGGRVTYQLDGRGRVKSSKGPETEEIGYTYDDNDRILTETMVNPNTGDQTTVYEYNVFGAPARVTDPEEIVTLVHHDAANNPVRVIENETGQAQRITDHMLDERGRIMSTTINDIATIEYEYFPSGRTKLVRDDRGFETTNVYDELGRLITTTDGEGQITHFVYDGNGNQIKIVDARGLGSRDSEFASIFEYDGLNRLISESNPAGDTTRYKYDLRGNQTLVIDPRSEEESLDSDTVLLRHCWAARVNHQRRRSGDEVLLRLEQQRHPIRN